MAIHSYIQRITEWLRWEGTAHDCLVQPPHSEQDHPETGWSGPCPISFWVSPGMETPQRVQCLVILTIKKVFLMFQGNLLYFHLCSLPLGLSLGTTEKRGSIFFTPAIRCVRIIPWILLFSRLNTHGFSQPLFIGEMLQWVGCLVAHCWTLSSMPMSFLC